MTSVLFNILSFSKRYFASQKMFTVSDCRMLMDALIKRELKITFANLAEGETVTVDVLACFDTMASELADLMISSYRRKEAERDALVVAYTEFANRVYTDDMADAAVARAIKAHNTPVYKTVETVEVAGEPALALA